MNETRRRIFTCLLFCDERELVKPPLRDIQGVDIKHKRLKIFCCLLFLVFILGLSLAQPSSIRAGTIEVNTSADELDGAAVQGTETRNAKSET
jgi:hypothetical protein